MAAAVDELCGQMRQDLYGLCQELSTQYKTIRQRAAALELKQLRRCYHEMGENTQRLVQRRARVLSEIRSVDPAGADAIERSEHAFCECAKHEGYLNARRRYLGELTSTAPKVTVVRPDTTRQRQQLSTLQQRRSELLSSLAASEAGHADLERQRIELTRQRDGVHIIDVSPLREQVAQIDADLASKHTRQRSLSSELDAELAVKHVPANPTLVNASQLLNQMTRGELTGLFLQPATGSNGNLGERFDMLVLDSRGTTHEFTSLSNARQHQAYLSLALATVATIGRPHQVEVPVVIDDAFVQIGPQDVDATLATLHDFSVQNDQQILLLSQHRYLADRLPGMPVFELASPDVRTQTIPAARPETVTRHEVTAPKRYDSRLVSSGVVANVLPAVSADRFKLPPEQAQPPQPISNRPYPLSKYSTNPAAAENHLWPALADETHQQDDYRLPWSPLNQSIQQRTGHTSQQKVKPMSARAFVAGQPATPVVAAIALDTLGLMDAQRLVMLADCGVTTAEQLLNIDIDRLSPSFDGHGITGRQVESWQDQAWLLQAIPQLQADEARLLVACGITDPQHLATSHADQLFERIQRYIGSAEGQRFLRSSGNGRDSYSLNMSNVQRWYQSLNDNRSAWENRSSRRSSRRRSRRASDRNWNRSTSSRSNEHESRARTFNVGNYPQRSRTSQATEYSRSDRDSQSRRSNSSRSGFTSDSNSESSRRSSRSESRTRSERSTTKRSKRSSRSSSSEGRLKFYLDLADHIEAAPSIGPKTAERFEAIGVSTVADFLRQTAESMATRLDYKRLSADTLRTWQHQTRLVCRVPNLRGHDAQLLVACGVTEPEELATLQPQSLFGIVGPFSETKEGLKIIRSGKKPDLAEITDWIQWAEHTRSLQAA